MIRAANFDREVDAIRGLINEYVTWLEYDLCFQGIDHELSHLDTVYGPPGGGFLVADHDGALIGCVAVRPLSTGTGEMKRLYVKPAYQGQGHGKALILAAVDLARQLGYARLALDAAPKTMPAQLLYQRLGFREIAAYAPSSIPDTRYYELVLTAPAGASGL